MSSETTAHLIPWNRTTAPDQVEAEARLSREGYESFRWNDAPGEIYPNHRHDYDECIWVLSGEMELAIAGKKVALAPGDRLYLPARIGHTLVVTHPLGVTYLVGQRKRKLPPE